MKSFTLPVLLASLLSPLLAQTIDTLGGTSSAPVGANRAKASLFRIDSTVLMLQYEMFLDVPGPETLTWFMHRYHSRSGSFTLEWSSTITVNGTGVGPAWYSSGPIAVPLVEGTYYQIGVSWPGSLTYHYSIGTANLPVSFGAWQRASTLTNPVPSTVTVAAGLDSAVYYQRFTTVPVGAVNIVGTGCSLTALVPRLVASGVLATGTSRDLELVDAAPSSLAVFTLGLGTTTALPTPLFGCSVWLDLGSPLVSIALITSSTGIAILPMAVPADPSYIGLQLAAQAGVLTTGINMSNALELQVN